VKHESKGSLTNAGRKARILYERARYETRSMRRMEPIRMDGSSPRAQRR